MSVTFTALTADRKPLARADRFMPCLCTQLSAAFREAMDVDAAGGVPSFDLCLRLAGESDRGCRSCHGKGVEVYEECLDFNAANDNARDMFACLGIEEWAYGEARVAELTLLTGMVIAKWEAIGVEVGPAELTCEGRVTRTVATPGSVFERVKRFADFLRDARDEGAVAISWG